MQTWVSSLCVFSLDLISCMPKVEAKVSVGVGGGGTGPRSQQGRRGKPANIIVKFFFLSLF